MKGQPKFEWVRPSGKRNEGLDCAVYALAGAHWVGIDRWRDGDWARREAPLRVVPAAAAVGPKDKQHLVAGATGQRISIAAMARFQGRPDARR
jgi:phage terminase large subunit GpA-like protein